MTMLDRLLVGAGVAALSAAMVFGGLWERESRSAFAVGSVPDDAGVQQAYVDALDVIKANYAGTPEIETVNKYAILGMLRVLDPHSSFLDSREFSELRNEQQSQLIGIGVTINPRNGRVYILSAVPAMATPSLPSTANRPTISRTVRSWRQCAASGASPSPFPWTGWACLSP